MLSLLPASLKNTLTWLVLGAIVVLSIALVAMDYRAKAAEAKAQGFETALTSYQAALTASKAQVEALEADAALEARLNSKLDGLRQQNEKQARAFASQQAELEKISEETRLFTRSRLPADLQRLLDDEDSAGRPRSCGHSGTCNPADPVRGPEPDPKRNRGRADRESKAVQTRL